jgi:hypothetical protein
VSCEFDKPLDRPSTTVEPSRLATMHTSVQGRRIDGIRPTS